MLVIVPTVEGSVQTAETVHTTLDTVGPVTVSTVDNGSTSTHTGTGDSPGEWTLVERRSKNRDKNVTWAVPVTSFTKEKISSRDKRVKLIKFNSQQSHRVKS